MKISTFQAVFAARAVPGPPPEDGLYAIEMVMRGLDLPPLFVAEVQLAPPEYTPGTVRVLAGSWDAYAPSSCIRRHLDVADLGRGLIDFKV